MIYRFDGREPVVGQGTYVSELATVIGDVVIGDQCYIGHGAIVRGDYGRIEIGSGTAVEEGVIIHCPPGDVHRIGEKVTLTHGTILHGRSIGDLAVIGMGAILSMWSVVGDRAIVAEGSVVKANQAVAAGMVVAGNPAQEVREVTDKDMELWAFGKQVYIDLAAQYLAQGMERIA
jgi:carbonic anhydrase/acetyltransferase-like protein (isoleucine patch superfamily)